MKKVLRKSCFFLVFTLIVVLLGWLWVLDSEAGGLWPKKQGELCWATTREGDPQPSGIVRLGINDINGGHYVLAGVAKGTDADGNPYTNVVHGNAEFIVFDNQNSIMMTAVGSERDLIAYAFRTGIWNVVLNVSTLNGNYRSIHWEHVEGQTTINEKLERGFLALTDCP